MEGGHLSLRKFSIRTYATFLVYYWLSRLPQPANNLITLSFLYNIHRKWVWPIKAQHRNLLYFLKAIDRTSLLHLENH